MFNTKKILFVIPPYFNIDDHLSAATSSIMPVFTIPYGVLSMEAYMRSKANGELEIDLVDLNLKAYKILRESTNIASDLADMVKDKVNLFHPDIVGISALFNTCYDYLALISNAIKEMAQPPLIVIGGGLATNLYRKILLDFPHIDAACYAEGEIPMTELVKATDYDNFLNKHPSWLTLESIHSGKLPVATYVNNLDEIPMFNYNLIDLNNYNCRALDKRYSDKNSKRELSIHTSRGCPFNCVFCANGKVHGKNVRFMSVDRVINEVEMMINHFVLTVLLIEDDHFLADKDRAIKILMKLREYNIRIEFPNGIAVYAIDEVIGKLLKEAGATTISLAVESGSDYVLKKIINKPLKKSMIENAVKILRQNGIIVHAFIVLGLPGEMDEHRLETMKMIKEVGFDWVYFFITIPIAGSRLYDICVDNNYLVNNDFRNHIASKANIKAPRVDPEKMEEMAYLLNLEANFVGNYNMIQGDYEKASYYFKNIVHKYPEHAFAHFYLAKTYEQLNQEDAMVTKHMEKFNQLVEQNEVWQRYAKYFNLK